MKISGDQNSILEFLKLLDKNVKDPWGCYNCKHLPREIQTNCNAMICERERNRFPSGYGFYNYILEIDYDGHRIISIKEVHKDYPNSNIKNGNTL